MSDINNLIGMRVMGSASRGDTATTKAPRDHVITKVWKSDEDGSYIAWSRQAGENPNDIGEHLRASTPEALVRRVMSLS